MQLLVLVKLLQKTSKEGAAVVVADYNAEAGEKVAEEIRAEGGKAVAQKVDVSNEVEIKAMVERAINEFGKLNILHNNAAATGNNDIDGDVVHVKQKLGLHHGSEFAWRYARLQICYPGND